MPFLAKIPSHGTMDRLRRFDLESAPAVRGWNLAAVSATGHALPLLLVAIVLALVDFAVLPRQAVFLGLVVAPLLGLVGTGIGWIAATSPTNGPSDGTLRFKHQVPERYHEEFSRETLEQVVEEGGEPPRGLGHLALFSGTVPVYTIAVLALL